jgi:outer membrane protein TolC
MIFVVDRIHRIAMGASIAIMTIAALLASPAAASAQQPSPPQTLTLGDAARLAARQSAAAQGASLRVEQAEARVQQRRADLFPNLSALASGNQRSFNTATLGLDFPTPAGQPPVFDPNGQVIGGVHTYDVRGRISQTIFDASVLGRWRAAQVSARAAGVEAAATGDAAASIAASAYVRVLRADAQLAARAADSALAEELLGIARDVLTAGVGVALDVTRAESQRSVVRAQLIAARNERDRARLELHRTLGIPLDATLTIADSLGLADTAIATDEGATLARAFDRRLDLRALESQQEAAERATRAVRLERLPSVGLVADQGLNGRTIDHMLATYTLGVQLSLPIFDGFRREARVDEQRAVEREIEVRRRDLREQIAIEVRGALLDLASAREQVDAARERLRLAEQELSQSRERFRAGVAGNADVITASLALTGARTQLNDALAAFRASRVALARAEGSITDLP